MCIHERDLTSGALSPPGRPTQRGYVRARLLSALLDWMRISRFRLTVVSVNDPAVFRFSFADLEGDG